MVAGEVHFRSLGTSNKTDARAFESLWVADKLRGVHGLGKVPTLSEFATRFINYLPGRVKASTMTAYVCWFQSLLAYAPLANCTLDKIDSQVIEGFLQSQRAGKAAVSSTNARLRVLGRALKLAQEWRVIQRGTKVSTLPGEHHREFVLSEEVLQKFLDRAPTEMHRALWAFLADTGLRISEAIALTWEDVEGDPPTAVHVRKGKTKYARRRVPVSKRASGALAGLPRAPFVFSRQGKQITQPWAGHPFLAIRRELNLPEDCVLHALRHSYLTRLGNSGVSPFVLQKLAGHSNIALTARYSHPDDEQLDRAVALLD